MGVDQVALDLLQDDEEHHEPDGLHEGHRQDQQRAHDGADPRAENGDQGGDAHQHGDDRGVGQAEDQHAQQHQRAQNDGLDGLAGDELGERAADAAQKRQKRRDPPLRERQVQQLFQLAGQRFLLGQYVHGEHHAHQQVHHRRQHRRGDADGGVQQGRAALGQQVGELGQQVVFAQVDLRQSDGILLQRDAQVVVPHVQRLDIVGDGVHHVHHGAAQTGDHHEAHGEDHAQHNEKAQQQADGAAQLLYDGLAALLEEQSVPQPLQRIQQQVQDEGQNQANQDGGEDAENGAENAQQQVKVVHQPPQGDDGCRHQQNVSYGLFVQFQGSIPQFSHDISGNQYTIHSVKKA